MASTAVITVAIAVVTQRKGEGAVHHCHSAAAEVVVDGKGDRSRGLRGRSGGGGNGGGRRQAYEL